MIEKIMADFKQSVFKGKNVVELKFEAVKGAPGVNRAATMQGEVVRLTIETAQQEMLFDDTSGQITINHYHMDGETGEIEPINAYEAEHEREMAEVEEGDYE